MTYGMASTFLPWHMDQWSHLYHAHQSKRLPHALLLVGQPGLGKHVFAMAFAQALLCRQSSISGACHQCRDCVLVAAHTHPDFILLQPETRHGGIKIEQVRRMIDQINHTSSSAYKIFVLHPADHLTLAAGNALLKNLEEPSAGTLFVLVTDKPSVLLPTIRSRCQMVRFTTPDRLMAKAWLHEQLSDLQHAQYGQSPNSIATVPDQSRSSGQRFSLSASMGEQGVVALDELYDFSGAAPLYAVECARTGIFDLYQRLLESLLRLLTATVDPIKLAESLLKTDLSSLLQCLMKIVNVLIKYRFIAGKTESLTRTVLYQLARSLSTDFLLEYFDRLIELRKHAALALNQQLVLEHLFCFWALQGKSC